MRVYLPMQRGELAAFVQSQSLATSLLVAPTQRVADEYGVTELEELEYAALEIARTKSEQDGCELIAAFELAQPLSHGLAEIDPGIVQDSFALNWNELVALYRITSSDEELEWYDVTEVSTVLDLGSN